MAEAQVILKPQKARPFFGRHPWVLDSAIDHVEGHVADGGVVDLLSHTGKFVARGLYNPHSRIRVRLYTWSPADVLDEDFWRRRIAQAVERRRQLGYDRPEGAARLIYSEADGLSGLVVDRYAHYLVAQVTALAMQTRVDRLLPLLVEAVAPQGIVVRTDRALARLEGLASDEERSWGAVPEGPVFIEEHGIRYGIELGIGQKTGFYLDQRENRRAAAAYVRGGRVLDLFCYTGGFSLAAARLGAASHVLGIDGSQKAIAVAHAGVELNSLPGVRFEVADCFDALDALVAEGERFDMVILDPPKFTRSRKSVDEALRAYHRINRLAVTLIPPGGTLVTCSCSGSVTREDFLYMLAGVAQQSGRDIQVLEQRGAAPDHPVSATCLETEYLKCFICRVV
ncbi:MAG: class I SAM-dependent rRNA methyltransferase [Planctomycetia bacterium]|nr:class I SAM-dependent rRNA methyltransferase [Planctomycetia bacterium]